MTSTYHGLPLPFLIAPPSSSSSSSYYYYYYYYYYRMEIVFPRGVALGVEAPTVDKYGDPVDKADR